MKLKPMIQDEANNSLATESLCGSYDEVWVRWMESKLKQLPRSVKNFGAQLGLTVLSGIKCFTYKYTCAYLHV